MTEKKVTTEADEKKQKPQATEPKIESEAPEGFRELKPGKQLCFGKKTFSAAKFMMIDGKWKRTAHLKNRFVPETVIKMLKADDKLFL